MQLAIESKDENVKFFGAVPEFMTFLGRRLFRAAPIPYA